MPRWQPHPLRRIDIARAQLEVRQPLAVGGFLRHAQHCFREVDTQDLTGRTDAVGSAQRWFPAAGRQIKHPHAGAQARQINHAFADGRRQA
jgi:hypothetical protein